MNRKTKFIRKAGGEHAHCMHSGSVEFSSFIDLCMAIRKYHDENKVDRILLNMTKATGDLSLLDRYFLGGKVSEIFGSKIKLSIYAREDQMYPDKFCAKVAQKWGAHINVFTDPDESLRWLLAK